MRDEFYGISIIVIALGLYAIGTCVAPENAKTPVEVIAANP